MATHRTYPIPVVIPLAEWNLLMGYAKAAGSDEVGGLALLEDDGTTLTVKGVRLFKQEVSGGEVTLDAGEVHKWLIKAFGKAAVHTKQPYLKFVLWHSHGTMPPFFSAQDEKWVKEFVNWDFMLSLCINTKGEYDTRLDVLVGGRCEEESAWLKMSHEPRIVAEADDTVDDKCAKEFKKHAKKKTFPKVTGYVRPDFPSRHPGVTPIGSAMAIARTPSEEILQRMGGQATPTREDLRKGAMEIMKAGRHLKMNHLDQTIQETLKLLEDWPSLAAQRVSYYVTDFDKLLNASAGTTLKGYELRETREKEIARLTNIHAAIRAANKMRIVFHQAGVISFKAGHMKHVVLPSLMARQLVAVRTERSVVDICEMICSGLVITDTIKDGGAVVDRRYGLLPVNKDTVKTVN